MSTGNPTPEKPKPDFGERDHSMKEMARYLADHVPDDKQEEFLEEISARVAYLKAKYPDFKNRSVSHLLYGSSFDITPLVIQDDFEGEDSIEAFLHHLVEKYKN